MTALKEFDRLEATGLWRPTPDDQRREVIVALGEATLTITDTSGRALAHWSLPAVKRANGTAVPAIFFPDGDPGETLEIDDTEAEMIGAIDRLLRVIDRRRPKPGKLRLVLGCLFAAIVAAACLLWVPGLLVGYAVKVVPPVKRAEIGEALLGHLTRVSGQACRSAQSDAPLDRLALRMLGPGREGALIVMPSGLQHSAHLPGGFILLSRTVIEDFEDPDVPAGFILAETVNVADRDPLQDLLEHAGLMTTLRLLTTGNVDSPVLANYAAHALTRPNPIPDTDRLLAAFTEAELRSTPYAYARDLTGETTLALIEADPRAQQGSRLVLTDSDWIRLQGICGA